MAENAINPKNQGRSSARESLGGPSSFTARLRSAIGRDKRLIVAFVMLGILLLTALMAHLIAPFDPLELGTGDPLMGPSGAHFLGTDDLGRDELSRLIFGSQITVIVAIAVTAGSFALGLPIGLIIGLFGGVVDEIVGRIMDVMFAFPVILLALSLAAILRPSLQTAILALVVVYVPVVARFVRGAVLVERDRDYVVASRLGGASTSWIAFRHILPNIAASVLVLASGVMGLSILAEAGLDYLGFGAQPPAPSWGRMLTDSSDSFVVAPYLAFFPGLAITYAVLAFNLLADGLQNLLNPQSRVQG